MNPSATPADRPRRLPHLPGLDGLRGLAVLGVLGFHGGLTWLRGGYLPVTAFFVLSGFLITALLLRERDLDGRIDLRAFWGRRARRLAPALLVTVGLVGVYAGADGGGDGDALVGDTLASLTWLTNWRFIFAGTGYADAWGDPSPLQHLWSLAVEEQFYVIMPLLAAGALALGRGRRRWLAAIAAGGAVGSVVLMRALHDPGVEPIRVYFGTDTRAAELLIGVVLATVLVGRHGLRRLDGTGRAVLDVAGLVALVASIVVWCRVPQMHEGLFAGGFAVVALLGAVVVAAATQPGTVTARLLGIAPLVAVGKVSYGAYLFHWPIFLWLSEERTGFDGPALLATRLATTFALAAVSFRFVEQPVRRGQVRPRVAQVGWMNASVGLAAVIVVVAGVAPAPTVTLRADAPLPPPPPPATAPVDPSTTSAPTPDSAPATAPPPALPVANVAATTPVPTAPTTTTTTAPPAPLRILVVGDSLAQNLATGLADWSARTGRAVVYDISRQGCGVLRGGEFRRPDGLVIAARAECATWTSDWPAAIAAFVPDVVVIESGITEIFDRRMPGWSGFQRPGDAAFDEYMVGEYRAAVDALVGVRHVVWATVPCIRWNPALPNHFDQSEGDARVDVHRRSVVPAVAASRAVAVADLHAAICPGGAFSASVAGVGDARPDGAHLTDAAAAALAEQWLAPLLMDVAGR